ncbi:hypothetical protein ESZ53_13205 [Salinibacterium sp. UTAS2018]|uniref:hypothetical protein n=1 Tax=Salinibacterium sp. UTAS2018 TaxID=2508880 RepID=UPI00100948C8|nr:hypothetical protein [Salinibacterium sp. UTAS2018]QAV71308.1 hypothetical protein ESZ53_13205 [Salinibacterium sp. UTAS2018]
MIDNFSVWHFVIVATLILPYAASVWAIIVTARETTLSMFFLLVWAVVLLAIPYFGLIAWVFWWNAGKRSRANRSS